MVYELIESKRNNMYDDYKFGIISKFYNGTTKKFSKRSNRYDWILLITISNYRLRFKKSKIYNIRAINIIGVKSKVIKIINEVE